MADYSEFVNRLSALTNLNKDVLNAWVSREKGVNNNILGVTSGGSLVKYPSQTAAAEATAKLIQSSPNYAGIRASEGKTSQQQALAIAQSPWRLGGAGLVKQGGTDPYYYNGFVEAGILAGNTSKPGGGVSTPTMPDTNTSIDDSLAALQAKLKTIGISTDPNHKFTEAEARLVAEKLYGVKGDVANSIALDWKGKTVAEEAAFAASGNVRNVNIISDVQNSLPNLDIPGALMFVAVVLIGLTFMILGGIIILRKK